MCNPSKDILKHVIDAHCHPTDSDIPSEIMDNLSITVCAMATHQGDQALVARLARNHPEKVVPCFGYHPWFSHWISVTPGAAPSKNTHYRLLFVGSACETDTAPDSANQEQLQILKRMLPSLPDPVSLEDCMSVLRRNFDSFPQAMLGEVGLDRSVRVPYDYRSEQRKLSPFTIPFEHQLSVLEAQLALAVEMKRNVSFHSVKSQKATIDLLNRLKVKYGESWAQISVDLHSCGLSPETWRDIEKSHANIYISLSTVINGRSPNHRKLISMVSPDRLLVESDIHEIGQCTKRTWDMLCTVAEVRGWHIEEEWDDKHNWKVFVRGGLQNCIGEQ
ncbi:TatD DNase family Scn1 [Phellopilus nigrolimitatus]|nr:TatD DNase family Scn1 [Phellopilus nigrolimitatus]